MADQRVNVDAVLDAIKAMTKQIQSLSLASEQEWERTRALKFLNGIKESTEAFCLAKKTEEGYALFKLVPKK